MVDSAQQSLFLWSAFFGHFRFSPSLRALNLRREGKQGMDLCVVCAAHTCSERGAVYFIFPNTYVRWFLCITFMYECFMSSIQCLAWDNSKISKIIWLAEPEIKQGKTADKLLRYLKCGNRKCTYSSYLTFYISVFRSIVFVLWYLVHATNVQFDVLSGNIDSLIDNFSN